MVMLRNYLKENPEATIILQPEVFPACPNFEPNFVEADIARRTRQIRAQVSILVEKDNRIEALKIPDVGIQIKIEYLRTGILTDSELTGFVVAPLGRNEEYVSHGFLLARPVSQVSRFTAHPVINQWLERNKVERTSYQDRQRYDSNIWRKFWYDLSPHDSSRNT